jgi:hypothetical protein
MSESGYQEIDLDTVGKTPVSTDIEIVEQEVEIAPEPEPTPAPTPKPQATDDDDDGDGEETSQEDSTRKRMTRSQRLKAQRDALAARTRELEAELAETRTKVTKFEADAQEGAAIGMDFYLKTLEETEKGLRAEFDRAFDTGDRDKLFDVQRKMGDLAAERKMAERERRSIPTRAAPANGGEAQPPAQTTTGRPAPQQPTGGKPHPLAVAWHKENQWFGQDPTMTVVARILDQSLTADGYTPDSGEFWEELDKRLRAELPHKFQAAKPPTPSPTIQTRTSPQTTGGKVRVVITADDRRMAESLGISIERYAQQKARREAAQNTANQYTEIL